MPYKSAEDRRAATRRYRAAHPERAREQARRANARYRAAHPDTQREAERRWRAANPDKQREYGRRYRQANPEREREKRRRRRAAVSVPFTLEQLAARMSYFGDRCYLCGGPFEHVDHVKPLARGGPHLLANLRPACGPCNCRKRDRWPIG